MKHLIAITVLTSAMLACTAAADTRPMQDGKRWPDGSELAVKAVQAAAPDAAIDDVLPGKSIGLPGANMVLWTIKLRGGAAYDVSGDGVLVHHSRPVEEIDLPTLVGNGKARVAPKGTSKIVKLETLGVIRFLAMAEPQVRYAVRMGIDSGEKIVTLGGDGKLVSTADAKPEKAAAVDKKARTTDGPVPELAAKAVKAMRQIFPDMVFDLVEEVPYVDGTTQTIEMLWYEVEFFLAGVKNEFNSTPDGVVIQYHKSIPAADLPKAIVEAAMKEVPGRIMGAVKSETRAAARFVALERPVTAYDVTPKDEGSAIKLRMDGTEVKEPEWPEWVKKSMKK
jgi:hypothetical protein